MLTRCRQSRQAKTRGMVRVLRWRLGWQQEKTEKVRVKKGDQGIVVRRNTGVTTGHPRHSASVTMFTEVKGNLPSALRQPRPVQCTIFANRNCAVDIGYLMFLWPSVLPKNSLQTKRGPSQLEALPQKKRSKEGQAPKVNCDWCAIC